METLDKLKEKIEYLLEKYEDVKSDKLKVEQDNSDLQDKIKLYDQQIIELERQHKIIARDATDKNKSALKKVSKLIDRIEQLQSEIEIS